MLNTQRFFPSILDFVLQNRCVLCEAISHQEISICQDCVEDLPWLTQACERCGKPLVIQSDSKECGDCLKQKPPYDKTFASFHYDYPIDYLITMLKFHNKLLFAKILGVLLIKTITEKHNSSFPFPELIIPVPLHYKRLRKRGFNQALEIAKPIARRLDIPIGSQLVSRIKSTKPQSLTLAKDRKKNIKGAFIIKDKIRAKHIAIVDDLVTTGNTVAELSRLLRKNGVERIEVWACAKTESGA